MSLYTGRGLNISGVLHVIGITLLMLKYHSCKHPYNYSHRLFGTGECYSLGGFEKNESLFFSCCLLQGVGVDGSSEDSFGCIIFQFCFCFSQTVTRALRHSESDHQFSEPILSGERLLQTGMFK